MTPAKTVLITRPQSRAQKTLAELTTQGYTVLSAPMTTLSPLPFNAPPADQIQALIATSSVALDFFAPHASPAYKALPLYCVGAATQHTAQTHGFTHTHCAHGTAKDLADLICNHPHHPPAQGRAKPYLYLRAERTAQPLEQWLNDANIPTKSLPLYTSIEANALHKSIQDALHNGEIGFVLFFAASAAQHFAKLIRRHGLEEPLSRIKALSISDGVLGYIKDFNWLDLQAAEAPTKEALYALLKQSSQ